MKELAMKWLLCLGLLLLASAASAAETEPNNIDSDIEEKLVEPNDHTEQTEDRIETLKDQQDVNEPNSEAAKKDRPRRDPAAEKDALRKERVEKQIQQAWDEIAILDAKMESQPRTSDRISYLKERARYLAAQERNLTRIKNLAEKNPDMGQDPVDIEKKIIKCRMTRQEYYDHVENLHKAERERKKQEQKTKNAQKIMRKRG